jgi:hypothetical protein
MKYDVRPSGAASHDVQSCGQLGHMLRDSHMIRIDLENESVTVDGFTWHQDDGLMPDLTMNFHRTVDGVAQNTWLMIDVYVNEDGLYGKYYLFGKTLKGESCQDVVYIDGTRR